MTNENDAKGSGKNKNYQEIVAGFQKLRNEQQQLVQKTAEIEADRNEHRLVIGTLEKVDDPKRRCFRLLGGVLVEHTVSDVLPALRRNDEQLAAVIKTLNEQLVKKGVELNTYREENNIRVQGESESGSSAKEQSAQAAGTTGAAEQKGAASSVLVDRH